MPNNRYWLCRKCKTVLRAPNWGEGPEHCGGRTKFITDAEARERIEGKPFKGSRRRGIAGVARRHA